MTWVRLETPQFAKDVGDVVIHRFTAKAQWSGSGCHSMTMLKAIGVARWQRLFGIFSQLVAINNVGKSRTPEYILEVVL